MSETSTIGQFYLHKPSEQTLEKIDFVIQGVENGLFADLSKKIDFHQKLQGEDSKQFVASLINFVEEQQKALHDLQLDRDDERNKRIAAEGRIDTLEAKVSNYNSDMRGVANALMILSNPDPLGQDMHNNVDNHAAEMFVSNFKNKY